MEEYIPNPKRLALAAVLCALAALACAAPPTPTPTPQPTPTTIAVPTRAAEPTREPTPAAPTPTPPNTPTPQPIRAATVAPTPQSTPAADATPTPSPAAPYDPTDAMYRVFPEIGLEKPHTEQALADVLRERDISQVPVLIEALRFFFNQDKQELAASTLRSLTGQHFDKREWDKWMEWYGANRDSYRPPEGYAAWKANLLSFIDDGYIDLLADAEETARIDLTEVVWGGVPIDGIPDLRDPDVLSADAAGYLEPRDRVFGVSINGQRRAYPLRITNPHEMVNDVLGGEPIALAW